MSETGRPSSAALLHPAGSKNPTAYEATATPEDVTLRAAPYAVDPDAVSLAARTRTTLPR